MIQTKTPTWWKETTLGDVVEFQRWFDLPTQDRKIWKYPLVVSNGIDGFVSEYKVKGPWVVTGRSWTLWKVLYIEKDFWPLNTTLWIKNFKGNNERFIYYWLLVFPFAKFNAWSGVPTLNRNHIHQVKVIFPTSLDEQKTIADMLSSFDTKIELLREQNKTLEATAQAIFQERFGKYSTDDELPVGWCIGKLGDMLSLIESGSRPKGWIDPNQKHGIPSVGAESINGIGNYNFSNTKYITKEFFIGMNRGHVNDYDVLIYKDGAYVGKKAMYGKGSPYKEFAINEHVFILRCSNFLDQFYLYFYLKQDELAQLNTNSAQPGLNQESMKLLQVIIPPENQRNEFSSIIKDIIDKILYNNSQIQSLCKTLDELLPRLMSGEVRLKF